MDLPRQVTVSRLSRSIRLGTLTLGPCALGIWKIIKGWLDPVVSAKVHFTNNVKELEGEEDWHFKFDEPVPGENDRMKDTATRDRLLAERDVDVKRFEELTAQWLEAGGSNGSPEVAAEVRVKRDEVAGRLRTGYWE